MRVIDWDSDKLIPLTGIMVGNGFHYGEMPYIYRDGADMASLKQDDLDDSPQWTGEGEDSARWPDPWKKQDLDQMRSK